MAYMLHSKLKRTQSLQVVAASMSGAIQLLGDGVEDEIDARCAPTSRSYRSGLLQFLDDEPLMATVGSA
jgi:hypothetical protein